MNKLLLLSFLLLSGCASVSEYRQGCYDGLDKYFAYGSDSEIGTNLTNNICSGLEEKRSERMSNPRPRMDRPERF